MEKAIHSFLFIPRPFYCFTLKISAMKKYIILFATVVLAVVFSAFSGTGGKMVVKITKGETAKNIHLQLANLQDLRTCVALQDMDGKFWYKEYVWKEKGYAVNLNLKGMPEGDYLFEIKNRDNRHIQAFSIGANDIAFFKEQPGGEVEKGIARLVSYHPNNKGKLVTHFTDAGDKTLGVQLANLQLKPVILRMVSFETGTVLNKEVTGQHGYAEKWDMEGMASTDYFFYVRSSDASVLMIFKLKGSKIELKGIQRLERPAAALPRPKEAVTGM